MNGDGGASAGTRGTAGRCVGPSAQVVLTDAREALGYLGMLVVDDAARVRSTAASILACGGNRHSLEVDELVQVAIVGLAERAGQHGLVVRGHAYGLINVRMRHALVDEQRRMARRVRFERWFASRSVPGCPQQERELVAVEVNQAVAGLVAALRRVALGCVRSAAVEQDQRHRLTASGWCALQRAALTSGQRDPLNAAQRQALHRARIALVCQQLIPRAVAVVRAHGFAVRLEQQPSTRSLVAVLSFTGLLTRDLDDLAPLSSRCRRTRPSRARASVGGAPRVGAGMG